MSNSFFDFSMAGVSLKDVNRGGFRKIQNKINLKLKQKNTKSFNNKKSFVI